MFEICIRVLPLPQTTCFMLFIYGVRDKKLKTYSDREFLCENCNSPKFDYIVRQKYFHLFLIPIVPVDKYAGIHCNDCGFTRKEIYSKNGSAYIKKTRTPVYMYSWLILIGLLIAYGITNSSVVSSKEKEYIKNPVEGDVYSIKFKDDNNQDAYTLIKIINVSNDSVYFFQCNVYYSQIMSSLKTNEYFVTDTFASSKAEIANMYNEGTITRIYRNYDASTGFGVERKNP